MNQASLGALLEGGAFDWVDVAKLSCLEWNCEDDSWARFDPAVTKIVHVKSALRLTVFNLTYFPQLAKLARLWREAEERAIIEE